MNPRELCFAPAHVQAARLRSRELSPVELMRATLERIEAINPRLNAFVSMRPTEELLADARAVEARFTRREDAGPLAGLPLGVKDLEDTVGLPNTHGSLVFKDHRPRRDTIQVERLKRAGAIVIGKTNTPEFGYTCMTTNRVFGTTRNPWSLERTPGGSSGGSSAAIAGGLVALATASDGGGSVRIPASYTGLVGLKPTQGRIPWGPDDTLRASHCIVSGPLSRTVEEAALWLDVTIGEHPLDPYSLPHPGYSYRDVIRTAPKPLRIAYSPTLGYASVQKQVRREVEAALRALEGAGHRVEQIDEKFPDVALEWSCLMGAEDFGVLAHDIDDESLLDPGYLPGRDMARQATHVTIADIQRLRARLLRQLADVFARCDLLATPTTSTVAFAAEGPMPFFVDGEPVTSPGGGVAFTYIFNFSGNPAISLRAGMDDEGLPVGLQLVAPRLREDVLLQVARQYEQLRPWAGVWPAL